jgi:alpha-tubulin suppressor-like RCC1 family protein
MGQVGDGSTEDRLVPTLISPSGWSALSLGDDYSCAVQAGALFCWGDQSEYQLGNGVSAFSAQMSPLRVGTSSNWTSVSAGYAYGCGLDGSALRCWGNNTFNQLGIGISGVSPSAPTPALVDTGSGFEHVAAGVFTTCGTTAGSALICWGSNLSGELGSGEVFAHGYPLTTVETSGWQSVVAGPNAFCGIKSGALYCWGQNESGALGHNENLVPGAVGSHLNDD